MEREAPSIPVIHVITPDILPSFAKASATMQTLGDRGALHIRSRTATAKQIYDLSIQLAPLQNITGCMLVINERVDVAMTVGARGVQLPERSFAPADVRKIAPDLFIGLSVHAAVPVSENVDWLMLGNIFETMSHPGRPGIGLEPIRALTASTQIPVIVIGGIRPENRDKVMAAGAYGVATLSDGPGSLAHYI